MKVVGLVGLAWLALVLNGCFPPAPDDGVCGDDVVNIVAGEECDDGSENSDTEPNACRTDCKDAWCGDAVNDTGEECDDGGDTLSCDADCTVRECGDDYVNTAAGEECDLGDENSDLDGSSCSLNCTLLRCGDGVKDEGDECGDDNPCTVDVCEDGICQNRRRETGTPCDDGLFCTVDDRCSVGLCTGIARDCGDSSDLCHYGECDEELASCIATPFDDTCVDPCSAPRLARAFRQGKQRGRALTQEVWDARLSCDRVEGFVSRMMERVSRIEMRLHDTDRPRRRCRYAGVINGVYAELDHIQTACDGTCLLDGEMVGELAARTYCDLAIETDGQMPIEEWIRRPVQVCGFFFENACDFTFMGETEFYSNDVAECYEYTVDAYADTWTQSRLKACDYHEHVGSRNYSR